ncbi:MULTISPECIES: hypothetical protein [Alteromonas]|uniref:Uncharacterized protein n=1 Tax=Alteromonas stellipolaris TaxID=233316 RepID=A0AAW7Z4B9_9ALTE|nr:hypothetical protein [Alteromonas stellipolaris]ANB21971.1 hypothetical protein A6K25_12225 [Alteromonas stellipolaris]MDO6577313.1 hypothetical protein [Alteromonas stellipolaris]
MKLKAQGAVMYLMASYLFVLLPFVILVIVKFAQDKTSELLLLSDWSIASSVIYGQLIVKLTTALAGTSKSKKMAGITFNITLLICFGLAINIVVYVLMLVMPSENIGFIQLILFAAASVFHFIYGSAVDHINKEQAVA